MAVDSAVVMAVAGMLAAAMAVVVADATNKTVMLRNLDDAILAANCKIVIIIGFLLCPLSSFV
jgi:hypothetical protein